MLCSAGELRWNRRNVGEVHVLDPKICLPILHLPPPRCLGASPSLGCAGLVANGKANDDVCLLRDAPPIKRFKKLFTRLIKTASSSPVRRGAQAP
jgi:hypothetical protein